ncbi:MAG: SOS response-associated peptidase [Blautia sp.]|jgi:putative SOS response-associated peptidase YedK
MCGRYYVDEELWEDIRRVVGEVDDRLKGKGARDVYPSQEALVITGNSQGLQVDTMCWGFLGYDQKRLLINARSETALSRRTFRESVLHRRCVIPARHFYEWDSGKNKVTFQRQQASPLYMAGFYREMQGKDSFIILTTGANASVKETHDRMPLVLEPEELRPWITDEVYFEDILHKVPPELEELREFEQQKLPF